MARRTPAFVERLALMQVGERIVITEEITPEAARAHARKLSRDFWVGRIKGRLTVELRDPMPADQRRKMENRLHSLRESRTTSGKTPDYGDW